MPGEIGCKVDEDESGPRGLREAFFTEYNGLDLSGTGQACKDDFRRYRYRSYGVSLLRARFNSFSDGSRIAIERENLVSLAY
jgi:hypothetical protein